MCRMDPNEEGTSARLHVRRGKDRPRRPAREEQPSRASISHPPIRGEMEEDQEAAIPSLPPRHSMLEWVGLFNQALVATATSSSGSQDASQEAVKMIELARRLGAQEF